MTAKSANIPPGPAADAAQAAAQFNAWISSRRVLPAWRGVIFAVAVVVLVFAIWEVGVIIHAPAILQRLLYLVFLPAFLSPIFMKHDAYMLIGAPGLFQYWWVILAAGRGPRACIWSSTSPRIEFGYPTTDNPWHCNSLEWCTSSPPPFHNFDVIPTVYRGPYEYSSPAVREDYLPQPQVLAPGVVEPSGH